MKSKEKKSVNKVEDSPPYVWTQEKSIILHLINKKRLPTPPGWKPYLSILILS